ncbi:MAG: YeeE/YedE thiosulfate transporter family protein [Bacillota bacterium]|nr:YeeE/YedE thiosulfate transporter family protein [Bacillota bacterium]
MKIFDKINESKKYNNFFKKSYPYFVGAILLSAFQIINFAVTGSAWGVSGVLANWGAWIFEAFGGSVENWHYFKVSHFNLDSSQNFFNSPESMRNIGIIFGALISTLAASEFKFKKVKNRKQVLGAVIGGLFMGYGARIAFGCNIGALYSGISSLSLSGWIYGIFMFLGAITGTKILMKFFM